MGGAMGIRMAALWQLSAIELADAIGRRHASSREVVDAHLRRIEEVDGAVNAVPVVMREEALEAARVADDALASGAVLGRFHGVPLVVKSNIDVAGTATTLGLKAMADAYPSRDAPTVERMRAAGAIPIARTNMPNAGIRWHCESELYGATINPWDRTRTAGGSSAGVAVACATGMSPMGLGNDGLGSLRHPAQCCGVVALKPTLGRVPDASTAPGPELGTIGTQLTGVQGPIARRIADLRAALEVIAGPTWRDPWSVPAPLRGPEVAKPIRVALVLDPGGQGTATQIQNGVRKAADALAAAGYEIEEVEPPSIDAAATTLLAMLNTPDFRATYEAMLEMVPEDTRRFLIQFYAVAGDPGPAFTVHSFVTRHSLLRAWGEFQERYPLTLGPVCTEGPFKAGTDLSEGRVAEEIRSMRLTIAVNALGLPALAVPVDVADGLPRGVQVIGPRYREDLCLDAGEALEQRLGVLTPIDPR
jgi:amidase